MPQKEGAHSGRRFIEAKRFESDLASGELCILASTDRPVRGEILVHDESAVDISAATALLINHDKNQLAGPIRGLTFKDGELRCEGTVLESAKFDSGVTVREALESGALQGVSIGYSYDWRDVRENDDGTYSVAKWRLLEVSLTPIPADTAAGIRSEENQSEKPTQLERDGMTDPINEGAKPAPVSADHITREEAEAAQMRAVEEAKRETAEKMSFIAQHKLEGEGLAERSIGELKDMALERQADELKKRHAEPQHTPVQITMDQCEKADRAAESYLMAEVGYGERESGNPLHGRKMIEAGVRWAEMQGVRNVRDWSERDQGLFLLGDHRNMSATARRDAANVISASFGSFVTLDAITKIVAKGFEQGAGAVNYQPWTESNIVPDFKTYNVGSLGTGNLIETAENVAFPELAKAEGVYSNNVKMWGGTLSLTLQALTNDDTGEFMRSLRQSGTIAQKTINKRVYQKLLMGTSTSTATSTWTNNTTVGDIQYATSDAAYAARQKLDGVIAALMQKTGQDGNPLGTVPQFLLCAPSLAGQAGGIAGGVAPGQVANNTPISGSLQVIASPWLATGSGLTGAASTSYYLLANAMQTTGMMVSKIRGMETPQVMQYDAGAVAAAKYKIYLPFEADLVNQSVGGTATIAAAQQGTAS